MNAQQRRRELRRHLAVAPKAPVVRDPRADIYREASDRTRPYALAQHIDRTMQRALAALADPDFGIAWFGRHDALQILKEAEPKYRRLGGAPTFWEQS